MDEVVTDLQGQVKRLKKELQCPICLSVFTEPSTLPCLHHFCRVCIFRAGKEKYECPLCKLPYIRRAISLDKNMSAVVEVYKSLKKITKQASALQQAENEFEQPAKAEIEADRRQPVRSRSAKLTMLVEESVAEATKSTRSGRQSSRRSTRTRSREAMHENHVSSAAVREKLEMKRSTRNTRSKKKNPKEARASQSAPVSPRKRKWSEEIESISQSKATLDSNEKKNDVSVSQEMRTKNSPHRRKGESLSAGSAKDGNHYHETKRSKNQLYLDLVQVNDSLSSERKPPLIIGTLIPGHVKSKVQSGVNSLGGDYVDYFTPSVTHLIVYSEAIAHIHAPRSVKFMKCVLHGCWIVSYKWILDSFEKGKWLSEEPYEVTGDHHGIVGGPMKSRKIHQHAMEKPVIGPLHGKMINLQGSFHAPDIPRPLVAELCSLAGAIMVQSTADLLQVMKERKGEEGDEEKKIVIVMPRSTKRKDAQRVLNTTGIIPVDVSWLFDSISGFKCLNENKYKFLSDAIDNDR